MMLKVPMKARCWLPAMKAKVSNTCLSLYVDLMSHELFHFTTAVKPCLFCYPLYCVCFQ